MKLSKHSKLRMKERTTLKRTEMLKFFKLAVKKGKCIEQIKNEKIKHYLASKKHFNSQVKLYCGYVFIYSRNSMRLYTMYKLPEGLGSEK